MLENEEISCQIPTTAPHGSMLDIEVLTASIRHAQICDDILKSLYSAKSLHQCREALSQKIQDIESRLEHWKNSLPDRLSKMQTSFIAGRGQPNDSRANAIGLLRAYNGSVIALHAGFHYPWIRSRLRQHSDGVPDAASASSARAAAAARQILISLNESAPDCISSAP